MNTQDLGPWTHQHAFDQGNPLAERGTRLVMWRITAAMDFNLKSAYLHVVADATTSVLAITALAGGMLFGWTWLDPTMGLVGAGLVGAWALGLLRGSGKVLLDREMDNPVVAEIRSAVVGQSQTGETRIGDLHVWRVGRSSFACALTVVTNDPTLTPEQVRRQLAVHHEIVHATIEIQRWPVALGDLGHTGALDRNFR